MVAMNTLQGLARLGIHLAGIGIRRIVREVATDDEQVLVGKPGFQCLGHPLQLGEIVGGDDNRYDGRHFRFSEK